MPASPTHHAGDSAGANAKRGEVLMDQRIAFYVEAVQAIKADEVSARLQREFFEQVSHPLETSQ